MLEFSPKIGATLPGTVVDSHALPCLNGLTSSLCQSSHQGTVSPTSYRVIFDDTGLEPDKLQRLTYKLCHLYFNWSGTVRVHTPVQYAHKLASLTGQALHRIPNEGLENVLFFL